MDEMKYTTIYIDDSRLDKRLDIAAKVTLPLVEDIDFCDGRVILDYLDRHPQFKVPVTWTGLRGEMGIWYSQMACWEWAAANGDLLVIEDDAILADNFMDELDKVKSELPEDWDLFACWVPPEQENDFYYNVIYDADGAPRFNGIPAHKTDMSSNYLIPRAEVISKAYQGYSFVTTGYSQKGGQKLLDLVKEYGIYTTADCFAFLQAHAGRLNAYAPKPTHPRFVRHENLATSLKGI